LRLFAPYCFLNRSVMGAWCKISWGCVVLLISFFVETFTFS